MAQVKRTRAKQNGPRGSIRISTKHKVTIPMEVLRQDGLKAGNELLVEAAGEGRIVLFRMRDAIQRWFMQSH